MVPVLGKRSAGRYLAKRKQTADDQTVMVLGFWWHGWVAAEAQNPVPAGWVQKAKHPNYWFQSN